MINRLLLLVCLGFVSASFCSNAAAQAGLRKTLEGMDTNENGVIEPDEITPLSRIYLERITKARRMSLDRPNDIDKLQEAARIYHAIQNGVSDDDVRPNLERNVKSLMPDDDQPLIPEFGLSELKFRYTQEDLDEADRTLRRYDRDDDGHISREEARRARWTHRDPFNMDLDDDGRLSRLELSQRYARRRMLSDDSDELVQRARRAGNGIESSKPKREERKNEHQWWQRGGKTFWLTAAMMGRFDKNRNGRLEPQESSGLGLPIAQIDIDRDGELSRDELHEYSAKMQKELGDESEGLPSWFFERDANQDEQVSMVEFTDEWTDDQMAQFVSLDNNKDGLITKQELLSSKASVGGSYTNQTAEPLPPGRTVISEIEVADDFLIADLNVQISITHSNDSHLDGYLTGPDGQRIELFTQVGGGDDNFDNTVFDDQAGTPITKARPPFAGVFIPEGLVRREPGLGAFQGKSIKGVWQLVIRGTRSDRFGMLHQWSLLVSPQEDVPGLGLVSGGNAATSVRPMGQSSQENQAVPSQDESERRRSSQQDEERRRREEGIKRYYETVGRGIEAAVASGKMTREQANEKWRHIKENVEKRVRKQGEKDDRKDRRKDRK